MLVLICKWGESKELTCLICWRVSVVVCCVGCTVVGTAAVSCSVAAVAHELSLADVSKTELTSGLVLLSDASYTISVSYKFISHHDIL
jgi:hypothetical protein